MLWLIVVPILVINGGVRSLLFPLYYERVRRGWLRSEIPLASILQSGEAVHAKGVGNLAALMQIVLKRVLLSPSFLTDYHKNGEKPSYYRLSLF